MAATSLSFSSLIRTRQSSVSGSSCSCVLGARCTTGGIAACDGITDCCWVPRFRAKRLFDLCSALGKPVADSFDFGEEGEAIEEPGFRSKTEPTRGFLSDIILGWRR
jgi:hypothetical protein